MSMISEQVKELRIAEETCKQIGKEGIAKFLSEAADTIESLSAKLQAANEEENRVKKYLKYGFCPDCGSPVGKGANPCFDCGAIIDWDLLKEDEERSADCDGWIACKERLPTLTGKYIVCKKDSIFSFVADFVQGQGANYWCGEFVKNMKDIDYWQPLPEPYHEP